jgi:serine/threonine protein kinase
MTPERWSQAKSIFAAAIELEPTLREPYVRTACGADEALLQEVMSLLSADSTRTMLRNPAAGRPVGYVLNNRYRVERELGHGGIGVVYLARDESLHNRAVVVKMPLDRSARDPWLAEKFAQEVKALTLIDHPGVVGALDSGVAADGRPFLVMQYIEGRSLRGAIRPEGAPLDFSAQVLREIGQALDAAHAKGIFHRDLKPANIMLQSLERGREHVRVIDFGLATIRETPLGEVGTRVAGTPHYMAPEQFEGHVSAASDIFALGVIAYELVCGCKPFPAENERQLHEQHRAGVAVKPSQLRPGVCGAVDKAILQALAVNPKDRPANAADFGEELANTLSIPARTPPRPNRRVALIASAGSVLALAGTCAWWILARGVKDGVAWFLMVQSDASGPAVAAKPGAPLHVTDGFFLSVRAPGGLLYLLSDDTAKDTMNFLGSFSLRAGEQNRIPENRPFVLDEPGFLNLWCAWSRDTIGELEPLGQLLNPQDRGEVTSPAQRASIRRFLTGLPQPRPTSEPGGIQQTIAIDGPRLAFEIRMEAK